jgi:hypothetical protein
LNTASADLGTVIEKNYVMPISPSLSRKVLNLMYMAPEIPGSTAGVLGDGTAGTAGSHQADPGKRAKRCNRTVTAAGLRGFAQLAWSAARF